MGAEIKGFFLLFFCFVACMKMGLAQRTQPNYLHVRCPPGYQVFHTIPRRFPNSLDRPDDPTLRTCVKFEEASCATCMNSSEAVFRNTGKWKTVTHCSDASLYWRQNLAMPAYAQGDDSSVVYIIEKFYDYRTSDIKEWSVCCVSHQYVASRCNRPNTAGDPNGGYKYPIRYRRPKISSLRTCKARRKAGLKQACNGFFTEKPFVASSSQNIMGETLADFGIFHPAVRHFKDKATATERWDYKMEICHGHLRPGRVKDSCHDLIEDKITK